MPTQLPLKPELAADNSSFMVHSRMEILYILRAILRKNELVTAYFNQGNDFFLTAILALDADANTLILDGGADEALNTRAIARKKIILVTAQDRVKVQFVANAITRIQHLGRPAFRMEIPEQLLKLQRREYYRLSTANISPTTCTIITPEGGPVEVTIADISLGGISIANYQSLIKLEVGDRFSECHIALPGTGTITTGMEIRNEHAVTLENGTRSYRAGSMFMELASSQQAMIQRYIIKLEREARAQQTE